LISRSLNDAWKKVKKKHLFLEIFFPAFPKLKVYEAKTKGSRKFRILSVYAFFYICDLFLVGLEQLFFNVWFSLSSLVSHQPTNQPSNQRTNLPGASISQSKKLITPLKFLSGLNNSNIANLPVDRIYNLYLSRG
jgi:hypothetical protein